MRARLALLASGQVVELREVVLADKPAALIQASPKATVPVLVLPGESVIEQSLDIMLWALRQNDPQGCLPEPGAAWDTALNWITQCDGPFKHHLDRYKYPHRYVETEGLSDGLAHRALGGAYLAALNEQINRNHFLLGEQAGLADMAIVPFVRQFAHTDDTWFDAQPWGALHAWLGAFEGSARFAQIMEKYPRWEPGAPQVLLPKP
jgi:glutathione S-transferase